MALKKWMKKFQPLSLYIVLTLTIFYFLLQLIVSNITHALTLTIDSYLMLCNLMALFGCIITIKICDSDEESVEKSNESSESSKSDTSDEEKSCKKPYIQCSDQRKVSLSVGNKTREWRLKNTFGWARIDVLVMLMGCVTFASLCFSTVLEALQTLFHISHQDQLHYPVLVFCVGAFGLVLNGLCYLLIGGYTFHHGSCLRMTSDGAVVFDTTIPSSGIRKLNLRTACDMRSTPGPREMCRDVIGCISVMICSAVVHFTDPDIGKLADPIFAIISASSLIILTYPYMKESCCILLQTIPNHINIDVMCRDLTKDFPDVINVHDLHVWQFSKGKTICTAHIIFLNPQVYTRIKQKVMDFFYEQGINTVTIQPEFFKDSNRVELISSSDTNCLVKCVSPDCYQRYCCDLIDPEELKSICVDYEEHSKNCGSKECPIAMEILPKLKSKDCTSAENIDSNTKVQNSDALAHEVEPAAEENQSESSSPVEGQIEISQHDIRSEEC